MQVGLFLTWLSVAICWFAGGADGHANHTHHDDGNMTYCATEDLDTAAMMRMQDFDIKKQSRAFVQPRASSVTVDTYFVVLTDTSGFPYVPDSQLAQQVTVLNQHFANSGSIIRFKQQGTTTRLTKSNALTANITEYLITITSNFRRGGLDALNIFVVPLLQFSGNFQAIGFTQRFFTAGVGFLDGVFIVYNALPNGGLTFYDNGVTGVHEVGHWLGLSHTFQVNDPYLNNPCTADNPNDYMDDTPTQFSATTQCPSSRDSCPNLPGLDPIQNFMDYGYLYYPTTSHLCKNTFSTDQLTRMEDVWYFYRVQNEICATNELQFDLVLKFDNSPENLSWKIIKADGTVVHDSRLDNYGGNYVSQIAGATLNITRCLPDNSYSFGIFNAVGGGIAAPGFYAIYINGQLIAKGGQDFTFSKYIDFGSGGSITLSPTPSGTNTFSPTISPTSTPTATFTLAPTISPTVNPTKKPTRKPTTKPVALKPVGITPTRPTPTAPSAPFALPPIPPGLCFSKDNTVEVKDRGILTLKDLKIGDMVKSSNGKMVSVFSFGHYHHSVKASYLQIHGQGLVRPLEISADHLVFVNGTAIPASQVHIGDMLDLGSGRGAAQVTKVKVVVRSGAYAPFTTTGTIMVSGVAASSYVTLQANSSVLQIGTYKTPFSMHWLAHVFQSPHRLACLTQVANCTTESYTEEGVSKWVEGPLHAFQWLLRQPAMVVAALFIPALLLVVVLYAIEVVYTTSRLPLLLMAVLGYIVALVFRRVFRLKPKVKVA